MTVLLKLHVHLLQKRLSGQYPIPTILPAEAAAEAYLGGALVVRTSRMPQYCVPALLHPPPHHN